MKNAAAYIRVSDERQDEFSPDSQFKLIEDFCRKNDYLLSRDYIFYDDGISAKSVEARQEFCRMIELAKSVSHPFDAIIVWKYSRFARNQEQSIIYKSLLKKHNVDVISVSEPKGDDCFGSLVERIIEWMDEYYLVRLSGEVRRGMIEKAMRGLPNSAPPIGYRLLDGNLVKCDGEYQIIARIYSLFLSGMTQTEIAEALNAEGIFTRQGKCFEARAITYILRNPIYMGFVRWSREGRQASVRNFESESYIIARGVHESIVSEADFKRAQEILDAKEKNKRERAGEYMLRSLVFCSDCHSKLTRQLGKYPSLQCSSYARGICEKSHSIKLDKINEAVISEIDQKFASQSVHSSNGKIKLSEFLRSKDFSELEKNKALKSVFKQIIFDRSNGEIKLQFELY